MKEPTLPRTAGLSAASRMAFIFLLLFSVAGCQLVADYDPVFDQEIVSTQRDVDSLLAQISDRPAAQDPAAPGPTKSTVTYAMVRSDYALVDMDFDDMAARASIQAHNSNTQSAIDSVRSEFDDLRDQHAKDDVLNIAHVRHEKTELDHEFLILMKQEFSKHHNG